MDLVVIELTRQIACLNVHRFPHPVGAPRSVRHGTTALAHGTGSARSERMRSTALILVLAALSASLAGDAPDPDKVKSALEKGVSWLEKRQVADGSFPVVAQGGDPDAIGKYEERYLDGTTALSLLTLLKCGKKPDDPLIEKGFQFLMGRPPTKVYSVALEILALEARFQPKPDQVEKEKRPYATVARDRFQKIARPEDKKFLADLVKWLLSKQRVSVWRYPSPASNVESDQDNSCTQYAVMALKAASRLGVEVPGDVWKKVALYFVAQQDASGPEVATFLVPAADGSITVQAQSGTIDKSSDDHHALHARGWTYLPRDSKEDKEHKTYGSMTCSGVAALVLAKSELEKDKVWWEKEGAKVDQGIRDGCAWLADNFSVKTNPGSHGWYYYYIYSLERAGVLAGTYQLGAHDWYDEGAQRLLGLQSADGSWPVSGKLTELTDTCFALLFLERGTIPVLKFPPKRQATGIGGAEPPPGK
jgi:hypothetical protein